MTMKEVIDTIPKSLIYEMVKGQAIYYKGYRDYLNGIKKIDEIMGSSLLQSVIISRLMKVLLTRLNNDYEVLTNGLGIQFGKKSWRAADIAIVLKKDLYKEPLKNSYLHFAPKIVIEIDTKAELSEIKNPLGYYHEKTDELLTFGVEKIIWIFSDSKKVMIAQKNQNWITSQWNEDFEILDGLQINITDLIRPE